MNGGNETLIDEARQRLKAPPGDDVEQLRTLAKKLERVNAFSYARRLYALALKQAPGDLKLRQRLALTTSKDQDLPARTRHDEALAILRPQEEEPPTPETQGIAGGICKRRWEVDGRIEYLESALHYYRRGFQRVVEGAVREELGDGYTPINAAFVLDLLADQEEAPTLQPREKVPQAKAWSAEARRLREALVTTLRAPSYPGPRDYWYHVTVAEALFGLGRYQEARPHLEDALKEDPSDWEKETTARQLARIARLHDTTTRTEAVKQTDAWSVLADFLGNREAAVRTAFEGKIGLALSGGGFRASLFHIGVLAKLAELDLLRSVEVLSCVSGGSIIGAYYYLEVRELLRAQPDAVLGREHYITLVERVAERFLIGVQRNIRTRIAANPWLNLRMLFSGQSRTEVIGELLERELFARVDDPRGAPTKYLLRELTTVPQGGPAHFNPKYHNGFRGSKVPILILNATSLNTGHNWQFTTSFMGEPPGAIDTSVDPNYRLRRVYFRDLEGNALRDLRLGTAVAASACVPGIFEPIVLKGLYPGQTVRLVDGGVHDNQGMTGLLEQDCSVLLISDASGQADTETDPSGSALPVLQRTNNVLMERVRAAQFQDLAARNHAGLLQGLATVHLKKDLGMHQVDWENCQDPSPPELKMRATAEGAEEPDLFEATRYQVLRGVQRRLAAIRTDLDAFSDAEAYALMTSGYLMMGQELSDKLPQLERVKREHPWTFLKIQEAMKEPPSAQEQAPARRLMKQLETSSQLFFKAFQRPGTSRLLGWLVPPLVLALLGVLWFVKEQWGTTPLVTVSTVCVFVATAAASTVLNKWLIRVIRYQDTFWDAVLGASLCLLAWAVAQVQLHFVDRWYLKRGRLEHILDARRSAKAEKVSNPTA